MAGTPIKASVPSRTNLPVFGTYTGNQASIFLEKSNPGLRRSTPDSEALASSDEEIEHSRLKPTANSRNAVKSVRRTFSLADHPSLGRKPSMTASGTYSPSNSNPATPAADQHHWPSMSPGAGQWANSSAYPWSGSIWSQDRKEAPARLQEMHASESQEGIPFSIPLQPTPKTYRSQSYSVGQLEPGSSATVPSAATAAVVPPESNRSRSSAQMPTLQRRTSRQGVLSSGSVANLGGLKEIDDDEDPLRSTQTKVDQAREIERLELENAQLRAARYRDRDRNLSSASAMQVQPSFRNTRIRNAVPEETDLAIDDNEEVGASYQHRNLLTRRFSEQVTQYSDRQQLPTVESRNARWQSTLGFGRLADIPQSRRHSFADVPTRQGSFSSHDPEDPDMYDLEHKGYSNVDDPMYFKVDEARRREAEASVQKVIAYANPYGIPSNMGGYHGPGQTFFIVNFKCCRSDIFYIQEGTGLQVQVGDLVIVDADRGTDLGAVQHCHVTLEEARRYKEYYAEEHYKLLMMFSQQTKNGGMNAVNPNGPGGRQSAVGGMGPQGHGNRDPHGDPKAKMIKRLAQMHEIQALKEKEGNEAKAKRVCSQKVVEHGLNMEILDAEFQMDSKKLTFYYFADEYINFNSLVTDLFKIYKTRIWMSAINPASFQTPTSSLGLTPAFGNPGFAGAISETPRRNPYTTGNGTSHHYEDQRATPRNSLPPAFYPSYTSSPNMGQRMGSGIGAYGANVQPGQMDPFAGYPGANFGMFNQGQGFPRHDTRGHGQSPNAHPTWISDFQGMSLN